MSRIAPAPQSTTAKGRPLPPARWARASGAPPPVEAQRRVFITRRRGRQRTKLLFIERRPSKPSLPTRRSGDAAAKLREKHRGAGRGKMTPSLASSPNGKSHALSSHGRRAASMTVGDILVRDFATLAPEDSLRRAMGLMTRYRTRHLPVLRGEARRYRQYRRCHQTPS